MKKRARKKRAQERKRSTWGCWHDPEDGKTYNLCPACALSFERKYPNLAHDNPVKFTAPEGRVNCDLCPECNREVKERMLI